MEIIDFEIDANGLHDGVIFVFGEKNGTQWGDDWNDTPYEHNRGPVYSEYVVAKVHYKLRDYIVLEPADNPDNDSEFSMENLMEREAPCTIFVPRFSVDTDTIPYYKNYVENAQVYSVYLGDTYETLKEVLDKLHSEDISYEKEDRITVKKLRKILQTLEEEGRGNSPVAFGYDTDFAYTTTTGEYEIITPTEYDIVPKHDKSWVYFRSVL